MKTKIIFSLFIVLICTQYNTVKADIFDRPHINPSEKLEEKESLIDPLEFDEGEYCIGLSSRIYEVSRELTNLRRGWRASCSDFWSDEHQ